MYKLTFFCTWVENYCDCVWWGKTVTLSFSVTRLQLTLQQIIPQIIIQVSKGLYPAADVCGVFAGSVQCRPFCTLFLARKDLSGRFSLKIVLGDLIPGLKSAYLVFTGKNDSHSFEPILKIQKSKILRTVQSKTYPQIILNYKDLGLRVS
jgi:hypothetical protein